MNDPMHLIPRYTVLVLAIWLIAVWVVGALYVVVSYAESAKRLPPRPLGETVRWALRELWLVFWTQPLMPYFQLFGARMGTGGGKVPVVLVHGYFQNRVDFLYLARRLRRAGCGPILACNFFWPQSLETSSEQVRLFIERVRAETGAERVDLLTHSSGGLFVLDMAAKCPEVIRKAAVIAIPAAGVPWRGPVLGRSGSQLRAGSLYQSQLPKTVADLPVLSLYSAHDNVVHPVTTSQLEGELVRNAEFDGPGHLGVLFDRRIADQVVEFLVP